MISIPNLSEGVQSVAFVVGVILLLKKIAEMDSWHGVRVFVLTVVLTFVVVCFFLIYGFTSGNPNYYHCVVD